MNAIDEAPRAAVAAWQGHPQWLRIAIGSAAGMFAAMGIGRFSYTTMVPALVDAGVVDGVAAGRIGTANLACFLIGVVLSVRLTRRWPGGLVPSAALFPALAAMALSAAPVGPVGLGICRGVIGITTGIVMVLSLALIGATAPAPRRPLASGLMFAGVGLAILLAGLCVPWLLRLGLTATWLALAAAAAVASGVAIWGWRAAPAFAPPMPKGSPRALARPALKRMIAGQFLFAIGIAAHTLYWVDYVARGLTFGPVLGGAAWSVVGVFSAISPLAAAWLARIMGTAPAMTLVFVALAAGVGAPGLWPAAAVLVASSVIFGWQTGLAALMAARVRDLADAPAIADVMRGNMLANAFGSAVGGTLIPWLYAVTGGHAALFVVAGGALALGAIVTLPINAAREPARPSP